MDFHRIWRIAASRVRAIPSPKSSRISRSGRTGSPGGAAARTRRWSSARPHGWPAVAPGSWLIVRQQFLDGLSGLVAWADAADSLETPLAPAIHFPPLAQYSRRDALVHVANHNAHHLGQVILLRQLLGAWPPPAGSWTW